MDTNWRPDLDAAKGPLYRALADQIVAAVSQGRIPPGARLPPVRDLAWDIKVSPGAVARAYRIATERGALEATVGRGTFARPPGGAGFALDALLAPAPAEQIDLRGNRALDVGQGETLNAALRRALDAGALAMTDYGTPEQEAPAREALAEWLQAGGVPADPARIVTACGAQEAVLTALCALRHGGEGLIAVEPLVHPGLKDCAGAAGVRLEAVSADAHGLCPEALDAACARRRPDAVLLTATFHNPTNATMPPERRAAIAAVARARDIAIIEDDVYGWLTPRRPDSFASLAPERCWYATSLSKCVAAGLRVGMLLTPPGETTRARRAHQAIAHQTPAVVTALAAELIRSGDAARIRDAVAAETASRAGDAARLLAGTGAVIDPASSFVHLPLPERWTSGEFVAAAAAAGVLVAPRSAYAVGRAPGPHFVRLALGAAAPRAAVAEGMARVARLWADRPDAGSLT